MRHLFLLLSLSLLAFPVFSQCPPGQVSVFIQVTPDMYPNETSWDLRNGAGTLLASGFEFGDTVCVQSSGCYHFTIHDSYGDGICCAYGNGSYTVIMNGITVASGGQFNFTEDTWFGNCPQGMNCQFPDTIQQGTFIAPNPDFWYVFIPDSSGQYHISTCSANCDTKIWVYDYCTGLVPSNNNQGTIYFDDNSCGLQAEVFPLFQAGLSYYIRIGGTGCTTIPWTLSYMGPVHGCMDPSACNFNPLATVTFPTDTCIYPGNPLCPNGPDLLMVQADVLSSLTLSTINSQNCMVNEGCLSGYGQRDIINFTTHIQNIGTQDYYIGTPAANPGQFVFDACHNHYHYAGYAEYILYDTLGNQLPSGFKNGFCVMDLECSNGGSFQYGCSNMGISHGCGDIYTAGLDCQWIDITNVPDGRYTLVIRVNWDRSPDALGRYEVGYENNWAQVCLVISRNPILNFTVASNCPAFVDCAGDTFGTAVPDCNGVCAGFTQYGDLNGDTLRTQIDVNQYVSGILGTTISPTSCNDLNQDGSIDVYDAALVNNCAIYGSNHPLPGGGFSNECDFPGGILNPSQLATFRIANHNVTNQTLEIQVANPNNRIKAYQFKMSGITVSGVDNLISPSQFPVTPAFNAAGMVLALSALDSAINRNPTFVPLVRIHYAAITGGAICLDQIISVVNENYEETSFGISNPCIVIVGREHELAGTAVKTYPNPFSESTTLEFLQTGNEFTVELIDLSGKMLRRYENIQDGKLRIEKGNLSPGTYFISLKGDYNWTGKLVIK